jgi:pyrroline-5-carboxylate reductase
MKKIAIVGLGNMGQALLRGLLDGNVVKREEVFGVEKDKLKADFVKEMFKINVSQKYNLLDKVDVIILAVKPQNMGEVIRSVKKYADKKLVISIAAGITTRYIKNILKNSRIVRCMPNTPALVLKGVTGIYCDETVTNEDRRLVLEVLGAIGETMFFDDESYIDRVTAISGSGPAYVFYFLEAIEEAGVLIGLSRSDARKLAKETFEGSIELIKKTGKEPTELREMVTSPAGTTIAALHVFEKEGVKGIIMDAIMKAYNRSKELGS